MQLILEVGLTTVVGDVLLVLALEIMNCLAGAVFVVSVSGPERNGKAAPGETDGAFLNPDIRVISHRERGIGRYFHDEFFLR